MSFFSDFQNYCRSFHSLADFWTVVAVKITRNVVKLLCGTRAEHLIYEMLLIGFALLGISVKVDNSSQQVCTLCTIS